MNLHHDSLVYAEHLHFGPFPLEKQSGHARRKTGFEDFCLLEMDLEVRDLNHVKEIISALRGSRLVNRVKRVVA